VNKKFHLFRFHLRFNDLRYSFGMWGNSLVTQSGKGGHSEEVSRKKKMKPSGRICFNDGYRNIKMIILRQHKVFMKYLYKRLKNI
jgi:hypothetical protein